MKNLAQYEVEATLVDGCLVHRSSGAARKVYQLRHGKLSSDIYVCHTCDNPKCILDAHHFPGTQRENMLDASVKGRLARAPVTRAKLREALLGKPKSVEAREHMRIAVTGRKATPEARLNMSLAQTGIPMLAKERAKLSAAIMGHPVSLEARKKIGDAFRGKPISAQHKLHIAEGGRRYREAKRQFEFEEFMGTIGKRGNSGFTP